MKFFDETLPELLRAAKYQARLSLMATSAGLGDGNDLLRRINSISKNVSCAHNASHMLAYLVDLLALPSDLEGCIVEAGCFKGGSAAKVSIIAKLLKRQLYVFDSFEGLPENTEPHETSILGHSIEGWFRRREFSGSVEEVQENIERYGEGDSCTFVKGWFENTMPQFAQPIIAAYLDVDLANSTRTCLKYLYPQIVRGGLLYSQDGDFPLVAKVFDDDQFWETEVGCSKPLVEGLNKNKMLRIVKLT